MIAQWHAEHWQAHLLLQSLCGVYAFSYGLERRSKFWLRIFTSALISMILIDAVCAWTRERGSAGEILNIVVLYLCLISILCFSNKTTVWTAMFFTSSGYIAQDIGSRFKYLLRQIPAVNTFFVSSAGVVVADLVCYVSVYLLAYWIFRPYTRRAEETVDNRIKAAFSIVVLAVCTGLPRLALYNQQASFTKVLSVILYQVFCGCFILIAQYSALERDSLSHQMDAMRELLHHQKVQYETSKENSALVNEKYHDLKKLIAEFRGKISEEQLDKLERHVEAYDTGVRTGSEVLDVVLAEKQMQCSQKNIQITCYADGQALNFVEELDLYCLLNNALTNAIEATEQQPEGERFITLTVSREAGMAEIHVENTCAYDISMENGLPVSKRDPRYHGFGMRSMLRTAEKYGGSLAVKYENQMFHLDIILFPPDP